jgi:hypothetical protein
MNRIYNLLQKGNGSPFVCKGTDINKYVLNKNECIIKFTMLNLTTNPETNGKLPIYWNSYKYIYFL